MAVLLIKTQVIFFHKYIENRRPNESYLFHVKSYSFIFCDSLAASGAKCNLFLCFFYSSRLDIKNVHLKYLNVPMLSSLSEIWHSLINRFKVTSF